MKSLAEREELLKLNSFIDHQPPISKIWEIESTQLPISQEWSNKQSKDLGKLNFKQEKMQFKPSRKEEEEEKELMSVDTSLEWIEHFLAVEFLFCFIIFEVLLIIIILTLCAKTITQKSTKCYLSFSSLCPKDNKFSSAFVRFLPHILSLVLYLFSNTFPEDHQSLRKTTSFPFWKKTESKLKRKKWRLSWNFSQQSKSGSTKISFNMFTLSIQQS